MKALNPIKYSLFSFFCILLLTTMGCKKSTVDPINPADPGYGCTTSAVELVVTNATTKMMYNPATYKWMLQVVQAPYIQTTYACDNAALKTITDKHLLTDIFYVTVSGNIKKMFANQKAIDNQEPSYPLAYLLQINTVIE